MLLLKVVIIISFDETIYNTLSFPVNGEYITACPHDDAVNILRNAGDLVVLTVKHYRAATPFLQKQGKYILFKL